MSVPHLALILLYAQLADFGLARSTASPPEVCVLVFVLTMCDISAIIVALARDADRGPG